MSISHRGTFGLRPRCSATRCRCTAETRAIEHDGNASIFHYFVIEFGTGTFDVQAYRDIDDAARTAEAIAAALGIARGAPTLNAR